MAIFSNELSEAEVEKEIDASLKKKIGDANGKITFEDFWGVRGFAYMINKQKWGYYQVIQFEISPEKVDELRKEWNLDKNIVRFLVTTVTLKAPVPQKYAVLRDKEAASKRPKETTPEPKAPTREKLTTVSEKEIPQSSKESVVVPATKDAEKKVIEKEEPKKPVKKDSVDKKLDEIINDSSLDL